MIFVILLCVKTYITFNLLKLLINLFNGQSYKKQKNIFHGHLITYNPMLTLILSSKIYEI